MIPPKALQKWDNEPARKISFSQILDTICKEYRLIQQIGSGGFGVVWSAERISDQMPVAIKLVAAKTTTDWYDSLVMTSPTTSQACKLPVEVVLHQRVSAHEGVISLLDYIINGDGNHVIVTARPPHVQDLFDFISANKQLDEDIVRGFFLQVVQAVVACHNNGVVHRDLKDENLLVDLTNGQVLLIDFGSSAEWQAAPYENFSTGTHLYCPPEWVGTAQYHAEKGTVWSLGILLYDMIYGDIPFRRKTSILQGAFDLQKKRKLPLHPDGFDLMWKCLNKNPSMRPNFQDILTHPWLSSAKTGCDWKHVFNRYQHNQWSRRVASEAYGGKTVTPPECEEKWQHGPSY